MANGTPILENATITEVAGIVQITKSQDGTLLEMRAKSGGSNANTLYTKTDVDTAIAAAIAGLGALTTVVVATAGAHTSARNTKNISTYAGSATTWALPTTSSVGDEVMYVAPSSSSSVITQGALQYIKATDSRATTVGATGTLDFNGQTSIHLICTEANKGWVMIGGSSGAIDFSWT